MTIRFILLFAFLCTTCNIVLSQTKASAYCSKLYKKKVPFHGIIGGTQAKNREFPHMVALGVQKNEETEWMCGGTLISPKFVLTAGHCTESQLGTVNTARMGSRNLKYPSSGHLDVSVKKIINHPNYVPPSHYNDIALLELADEVVFSRDINPACLLTTFSIPFNDLTAIGWGRTDFTGPTSDDLLKVTLQKVARNTCNTYFKNVGKEKLQRGIDDKLQLCAGGGLNGARDTCQGDSGGPLSYLKKRQHFIAGITSFGKACGIVNTPAVYTRVSAFVPWIESIVWK